MDESNLTFVVAHRDPRGKKRLHEILKMLDPTFKIKMNYFDLDWNGNKFFVSLNNLERKINQFPSK